MTEIEEKKIINFIENEYEGEYLDFKLDIYDFSIPEKKTDFIIDILSMANSNYPDDRYIIVGVKDYPNRQFKSVDETKVKDSATYQQLVNENIEPAIKFDIINFKYNGFDFFIYKIAYDTIDRPYIVKKDFNKLLKGTCRIRKGSQNAFMTRYDFDKIYEAKNPILRSNIKVKCIDENGNISEKLVFKSLNYTDKNEKFKQSIINEISEANRYKITDFEEKHKTTNIYTIDVLSNPLKIEDDEIEIVSKFIDDNNICIDDDFFYSGNAGYRNIVMGNSYTGSEQSIEKYEKLEKIIEDVRAYYQVVEYREKLSNLKFIELVVSNIGNSHDEQIDVSIHVPKELFILDEFPVPNYDYLDSYGSGCVQKIFKIEKVYGVSEANIDYIPIMHKSDIQMPLGYEYNSSYEELTEEYYEEIRNYIHSELSEKDDMMVLTHTQKMIKSDENLSFPSRLFFSGNVDSVKYTIRSKFGTKTIEGEIRA